MHALTARTPPGIWCAPCERTPATVCSSCRGATSKRSSTSTSGTTTGPDLTEVCNADDRSLAPPQSAGRQTAGTSSAGSSTSTSSPPGPPPPLRPTTAHVPRIPRLPALARSGPALSSPGADRHPALLPARPLIPANATRSDASDVAVTIDRPFTHLGPAEDDPGASRRCRRELRAGQVHVGRHARPHPRLPRCLPRRRRQYPEALLQRLQQLKSSLKGVHSRQAECITSMYQRDTIGACEA